MKATTFQVEHDTRCDRCGRYAAWSICNLEGGDMRPVVRWFACGQHLHAILTDGFWDLDAVMVYDLRGITGEE